MIDPRRTGIWALLALAAALATAAGCASPPRKSLWSGEEAESDSSSVVAIARSYLGVPYRYGGADRSGVDCSGLVMRVFATAGIELPRSCAAQYGRGVEVARDELAPGDLVFFGQAGSLPSHVGIYEGDGRFIHASVRDSRVRRDSLDASWFRQHYRGGRRVLPPP